MDTKIIIASGPVIVEDGKVLLDEHGDTDYWKFCGGEVQDFTHDLIENAKNRAKEEIGVDVEILDETPFIFHTTKVKEYGRVDYLVVHFLAKRIGEVVPGSDIREWAWIPLNELRAHKLAPSIMPALKHFKFQ